MLRNPKSPTKCLIRAFDPTLQGDGNQRNANPFHDGLTEFLTIEKRRAEFVDFGSFDGKVKFGACARLGNSKTARSKPPPFCCLPPSLGPILRL
ncbi:hypothetical protein GCM10010245_92250 [Streptomyces spectabilis]|nr:hypothetical protein GCM10010245_92250 [Streptomyces spectabilis]